MQGLIQGSFCVRLWSVLSLCLCFTSASSLQSEVVTTFSFEAARTVQEQAWGLMARRSIPRDHGMLFIYQQKDFQALWSFNCKLDFTVAFLDDSGKILSIQDLLAHPAKMRAFPELESIKDFSKVDWKHPNIAFFREQGVKSPERVQYVLEMRIGWFRHRGVEVGDYIEWSLNTRQGRVIRRDPTQLF